MKWISSYFDKYENVTAVFSVQALRSCFSTLNSLYISNISQEIVNQISVCKISYKTSENNTSNPVKMVFEFVLVAV